ncbi:unnamed protein product [Rhizophagus irregularis]|nr:unnamed protein product [Rhizophagus irregularis]
MNSNNNTMQAYSDSLMNQAENDFAPLQILDDGNDNVQHNLINNAGISNMNSKTLNINTNNISTTSTATSIFQNTTFEFYTHLPNDTRIYRVTYVHQKIFDS